MGLFTQQDPIGIAGGLNLYGYANGDPINFSDPFGLCPEELRDENAECPGGLTVDEWAAVEAAREFMDAELSTMVGEWLEAGKIRSRNMVSDETQAYANPYTLNVVLNTDLPLGSTLDPEVVRSSQLAFIIAHEFGHVNEFLGGLGAATRKHLSYLLSKSFYERKADNFACGNTTAGQPIYAATCLAPGR